VLPLLNLHKKNGNNLMPCYGRGVRDMWVGLIIVLFRNKFFFSLSPIFLSFVGEHARKGKQTLKAVHVLYV
jgi:hypothetical protein